MGREYVFNNAPAGQGPWLRATFTQQSTNTVALKLEQLLNSPSESVNRWLFNLDPGMNLSALQITQVGGPVAHIHTNANGVGAGGGSLFDIRFLWPGTANRTFGGSAREVNFLLTMDGLTPESFLWGSIGGRPGATNLASSALVFGTSTPGQTWLTHFENSPSVAPLPPAVWAGAAGLALAGMYVRRRRR
jgi:hypothetical protein